MHVKGLASSDEPIYLFLLFSWTISLLLRLLSAHCFGFSMLQIFCLASLLQLLQQQASVFGLKNPPYITCLLVNNKC